jgi:NarL family two-component system response regulator LiaR
VTAIRLALSNDFRRVIAGLQSVLAPYADRVEVVELTTERTVDAPVDVILYDTFGRLPGDDEKLGQIVAGNDAKVVVYSWDNYTVEAATARGAAGFIHKGLEPEQLVEAIEAIFRGEYVESPTADGVADDDAMPTWPGQEFDLSPRESEILSFIAQGYSNEEIAAKIFLSINTVKTYIRTAYRKIGATTRAQAVRWASQHGFDLD